MATRMETTLLVLVLIAIILSAASLYYVIDLSGRVTNIADAVIKPTLRVVGPWSGSERAAFLPVLDSFEKTTGIKTDYRTYRAEDLSPLLPAQFAARTAFADLIFMWPWFIADQGTQGHVMDVTASLNETDFSPGALDPVKAEGKIWGGAYTGKVKPGFWYRKSFFTANNLTVPTTWDQFIALIQKIKTIPGIQKPIVSGDGDGWPLTDVTEHFIITFGGPQLQKNLIAGNVSWTSSQVRNTVFRDRLIPLLNSSAYGAFSAPIEWTSGVNLFWNNEYALYFMGSWITGMVPDPTDLGVFTLPGCTGLVFAADYFFVPAYTQYPKEAMQLFEYLSGPEAQTIQVQQGGNLATNVHVLPQSYPTADRAVAQFITGKELLLDLDDTIGGQFQATFWDQLKLLWVNPAALDSVLAAIQAKAP